MNWKREFVVWAVGNLAWMLVLYAATQVWYRVKRLRVETVATATGVAIVGIGGLITSAFLAYYASKPWGPTHYAMFVAFGSFGATGFGLLADHILKSVGALKVSYSESLEMSLLISTVVAFLLFGVIIAGYGIFSALV